MTVCLVHHADACPPQLDAQQPLTERGHDQARSVAEQVHAAGFAPAAIWHSGKLRARQTAEPFLRLCNPSAEFRMVRGLRPGDPIEWMLQELLGETRNVLLVGHRPHLPALALALAPGADGLPVHGAMLCRRNDGGTGMSLIARFLPNG